MNEESLADLEFLADEVRRLHTQWECFNQFFLTQGRQSLRQHASHTLGVIKVALATDMLMTVSRVCDREATYGESNLALAMFMQENPQLEPLVRRRIDQLTKLYRAHLKPTRDTRLAHNGLLVVRGHDQIVVPKLKALRIAVKLCDRIVGTLFAQLERVAISFPPSSAAGEIDWIEASLRHIDEDRLQIKKHLESVRKARYG